MGNGLGFASFRTPLLAAASPDTQEVVSGGREEKRGAGETRTWVFKNSAPGLNRTPLFSPFFTPSLPGTLNSLPSRAHPALPPELQTHRATLQLAISAETSSRHLKLNTSQTKLPAPHTSCSSASWFLSSVNVTSNPSPD